MVQKQGKVFLCSPWGGGANYLDHRYLNNVKFSWDDKQGPIASRVSTGGEPDATYHRLARVHQAATLPGAPEADRATAADRRARARERSQSDPDLRSGGLRQDHSTRRMDE